MRVRGARKGSRTSFQVTAVVALGLGVSVEAPPVWAFECARVPECDSEDSTCVEPDPPALTQAWNQRCVPFWIRTGDELFDRPGIDALVEASFARWSGLGVEGTDLEFRFAGRVDQGAEFDRDDPGRQRNVVLSASGLEAAEVFEKDPSVLALTITTFSASTGELFDADIVFNLASSRFGIANDVCDPRAADAPFDIENTLIHEVGHFIGFGHTPDVGATMFAVANPCEITKRSLSADDLAGLRSVYPRGLPTMTCHPPESYDVPGQVVPYRDQCGPVVRGGSGCRAGGQHPGGDEGGMLMFALTLGVLLGLRFLRV